jgi:hypothetical protein
MTLLLAVLAIAYVGSMLMQGRALRGVGLPSGTEWVLLGFALGSHALAVVDRDLLAAFEPVAAVAIGWQAFALGARFGRPRDERTDGRSLFFGFVFSVVAGSLATASTWFALHFFTTLASHDRLLISIGAGLVSCELTRHAVTWVVERYAARGPLASFVTGVSEGSAIVPLLGCSVPFALVAPRTELAIPVWGLVLMTLGLGVVLALMCAALISLEASGPRTWGVLLGAALLGTGISFRFGLSPLAAMFAVGLSLAVLSKKRAEVHAMLARTEHPVRLPILLLCGAHIDLYVDQRFSFVIAAAVLARVLSASLLAWPVGRASGSTRHETRSLIRSLLPTGAITMTIGLSYALRFPDRVGTVVLLIAAAQTVLGELFGPLALRRALDTAGELPPDSMPPPAAPPRRSSLTSADRESQYVEGT